jgi:uroporphyrinogen decarboxylase
MNLFQKTLARSNDTGTPPIWLMRQAGRYHAHYQNLRKTHGFLDLCRNAKVSAEAAMGPIRDFDFDAAILFSDILFPIEAMGVSLDFNPGPQLGRLLGSKADLAHYTPTLDPQGFFGFQAVALAELRRQLPAEKGLIGFVGGPLTLYQFACTGSGKPDAGRSLPRIHGKTAAAAGREYERAGRCRNRLPGHSRQLRWDHSTCGIHP